MRTQGQPRSSDVQAPPSGPIDSNGAMTAVLGGANLTQTRTKHVTAVRVQVPRDLDKIKEDCIKEAQLMGEDFFYAWEQNDKYSTTGKSLIKGMGIEGALVLARNWSNCTCEIEIVEDAPSFWVLQATFIDFERGFTLPRLFRQRKVERHGKFDAERALDIAFQIGQSKAQRNAIDKAMPQWLVRAAMEAATAAAEKRYENVKDAVARFVKYAQRHGIAPQQLEARIGRPFANWNAGDCVLLASVFRAIQQNEISLADAFPPIEVAEPPAAQSAPTPAQTKPAEPVATQAPAAAPPAAAPQLPEPGPSAVEQLGDPAADPRQIDFTRPTPQPEPATKPQRRRAREPGEDDE